MQTDEKVKKLKKRLIKFTIYYLIGFIAVLIIYFIISSAETDLEVNKQTLKNEINNINARITEFTLRARELNEAVKLWNNLNAKHKSNNGLNIDFARELIAQLKKKYNLIDPLDVNMTAPSEINDFKTETTILISSTVSLRLNGYTDEYILQFISAIIEKLPGFIKIKSLLIKRNVEDIELAIDNLKASTQTPFVQAEFVFEWIDFKVIEQEKKAM